MAAISLLALQFLAWVADRPRTRADVMDAWRSNCPRTCVWEDCIIEGLVRLAADGTVALTALGQAALDRARSPSSRTRHPTATPSPEPARPRAP